MPWYAVPFVVVWIAFLLWKAVMLAEVFWRGGALMPPRDED